MPLLGPFQPTVDTAIYADGDRLGSVVTVSGFASSNQGTGIVWDAFMEDDAASNFSIEAHFFQNSPTMANADNGVFDISDANQAAAVPIGVIDFLASNSKVFSSNRVCTGTWVGGQSSLRMTCASGTTSIFFICRARGGWDGVATDDLTFWFDVQQL